MNINLICESNCLSKLFIKLMTWIADTILIAQSATLCHAHRREQKLIVARIMHLEN